ncbi:hypothetical protein DAETH_39960 (plasmid) [Deinococcus aetherius]|uniref:Cupin type-2 domain-containing protein n=2 Tax=Deinococcus aetherius TaxID=200252 RepID=A0ABN6RL22_9DEIO|nr:hypothetical protein DAETH_39960 [Deinococcus aetherius]
MKAHATTHPRIIQILGSTITLHHTSADTNGEWSLLEYDCPAQFTGPPPHIHDTFEEVFHVLSGRLTFTLGGETTVAGAGETVRVPRGVPHTFSNPEAERARFLILNTPGGFERYFMELAPIVAASPVWPPEDRSVLAGLAHFDQRPA